MNWCKSHGYLNYIPSGRPACGRHDSLTPPTQRLYRVAAGFHSLAEHLDCVPSSQSRHLGGVGAQDVGVTGIEDGHGRAAEELTAGGAKLNLQITNTVSLMLFPSKASSHVGAEKSFFSGL